MWMPGHRRLRQQRSGSSADDENVIHGKTDY